MTSAAGGRTAPTRAAVMDAVLVLLRTQRLRDLTLEDVADHARVSRQTVYRHFGSRDGLLREVVLREEQRLADGARAAVVGVANLEDAVSASVTALLEGVREHPLIDRLIADDPETLLPFLALGQGPVLSTAVTIVAELVRTYLPERAHLVDDVADVLSRIVISYTIAPGGRRPAEVGRLAARVVSGGVAGARD